MVLPSLAGLRTARVVEDALFVTLTLSTATTLSATTLGLPDDLASSTTHHLGSRESEQDASSEDSDLASTVLREGTSEGLLARAGSRGGRG